MIKNTEFHRALGIQRVPKALGIEMVMSYKIKVEVLDEYGFPVISKRIAGKIDMLQHPTEECRAINCCYWLKEKPCDDWAKEHNSYEMDEWYNNHIELFEELYYQQPCSKNKDGNVIPYEPLETIIPTAYEQIKKYENDDYCTTRAQRTGCSMCGFGIHFEE
ncbi:MAG: hypothetical protein ACI4AA_03555 [Lachnospiraceae bacterium]